MHIEVSIPSQTLTVYDAARNKLAQFPASTAANGVGCEKGSYCTPLGLHVIRAKIGAGAPINTVFKGRRATGEICTPTLVNANPGRDWILTRILWLSGCEIGKNRLGNVDTMQRYIYIHGTPDSTNITQPGSHGCIRLHNHDVIALFDLVAVGTVVNVVND